MKEIKFDSVSSLELLLNITLDDENIDLHNDFDCTNVKVVGKSLIVTLEKASYVKDIS